MGAASARARLFIYLANYLLIYEHQGLIIYYLGGRLEPVKYAQKFCENLKSSQIVIIEELGHFTFYEDPTKLSSELGKLLSS